MKVVIDSAIPLIKGILEPYASVDYVPGAEICAGDVRDADALIVRTRTAVGRELLDGSRVKFVATATIGTDHMDLEWCRSAGITVCSAAGCNAGGVAQWVLSAFSRLLLDGVVPVGNGFPVTGGPVGDGPVGDCGAWLGGGSPVEDGFPVGGFPVTDGPVLGIVGVGHVGGTLAAMASQLGIRTLLCDPPRAAVEGNDAAGGPRFVDLESLLPKCDMVSVHVPLDASTRGLISEDFLGRMRPGAVLANSSRGGVMDGDACLAARLSGHLGALVVDTWPGEPAVQRELVAAADIATPHIAGYSFQGKQNATTMVVRSLASFFGIDALRGFTAASLGHDVAVIDIQEGGQPLSDTARQILSVYDVAVDSAAFKAAPERFEALRDGCIYRDEMRFRLIR